MPTAFVHRVVAVALEMVEKGKTVAAQHCKDFPVKPLQYWTRERKPQPKGSRKYFKILDEREKAADTNSKKNFKIF